MFAEFERIADARELREAQADPEAHKLSRSFSSSSAAYRYFRAGKDGRGREVRFAWSSHRNIAGYFLSWREVVGRKETKRDHWSAKKVRKVAKAMARKRCESWKAADMAQLFGGSPSAPAGAENSEASC
jgi:hypothetical protein